MNSIKRQLETRILLLDGAMGTMIQRHRLDENDFRGKRYANHPCDLKGNNDMLCLTRPDIIEDIHRQYIEAGADIISTNSFNANSISQGDYGMSDSVFEINTAAARIARNAADTYMSAHPGRTIYVAGSIGPTNRTASISPKMEDPACRNVTFDMLYEAYAQQIEALGEGGCDLLLFETVFDTLNLKAGLSAAETVAERTGRHLPIMVSATIAGRSGRILSGQTIAAFISSISHHKDILSIGLNCSWGASEMRPYIAEMSSLTALAVSCHPNAGLPDENGQYAETPVDFARAAEGFLQDGSVNIIGGCCGTTPEHIKALSLITPDYSPRKAGEPAVELHLAGLDDVTISRSINFVNIGERCNVAGSRKFLRLISEHKYDEALAVARRQVEDGAQIIDINMDDAMIDARHEMIHFLNLIASDPDTARVPLMIDSSKWEVLTSGLKCIQGRAVVNSISLKEGVEPFLRKARHIGSMGAAIVVMAFDEEGQADTFERKTEICSRAYRLLVNEAGIKPCDIIFDPNIMAIATGIESHNYYARDFIRATRWIKENLPGAKVSGGVSNLSFAFRGHNRLRESIHAVFLYHAISAGLDMAIVNPATNISYDDIEPGLRKTIEELILEGSHDAAEALADYASRIHDGDGAKIENDTKHINRPVGERLTEAIIKGLSDNIQADLEEAATIYPRAIDIIEGPLMDGVNHVGNLFGEGKMFLPQVVKTARVMKQAVDILKPRIDAEKAESSSGPAGKILFATVKGDVHDIGKNIVSIVLECNNYEVIDLGVMVPAEEIVRRAITDRPDVICLSGLITPSLGEMTNVADKLEAAGLDIPLIVGGATTSKLHTALHIAPHLSAPVIHAADASQNPVIVSQLLNKETRKHFISDISEEYERIRTRHHRKNCQQLLDLDKARAMSQDRPGSAPKPDRMGLTVFDGLETQDVAQFINWRMFFHAWHMTGPFIEDFPFCSCIGCRNQWLAKHDHDAKAIECVSLYDDAIAMLSSLPKQFIRAAVGLYPASSHGDDLTINGVRIAMLRRQTPGEDGLCRSICDYFSDGNDYAGVFAINAAYGLDETIRDYEQKGDKYALLLLRSLLDRLAEAASEYLHYKVRTTLWGYSKDEELDIPRIFRGEYCGIRPAAGYPMLPDQTITHLLGQLVPLAEIGISLTENGAMMPQSAVCGIYIGTNSARYFNIGKIGRDQVADYARRRGMSADDVSRILSRYVQEG